METAAASDPTCQHSLCTADLIRISLFFCLHSCKFTKTQSHRRTIQFLFQDIQFYNEEVAIQQEVPDKHFLYTCAVTLFLNTQKNFVRGESTTMDATDLKHRNSVSVAARRFLHLQKNSADPESLKCNYYPDYSSTSRFVTRSQVIKLLRLHTAKIGFQRLGFHPHEIGFHSLLSGGAITLHQSHIPDSTININGRWFSDSFLVHLQG